jgi:phage anti-repressor protein
VSTSERHATLQGEDGPGDQAVVPLAGWRKHKEDAVAELIVITERAVGSIPHQTANARDIHAFLGVKARFNDWILRRIEQYGFTQDIDFTCYSNLSSGNVNPPIEYYVTIAMGKELAMVERTKKGKEARQYFLACEKALQEKTGASDPVDQFPELRAIRQLVSATAEARIEAEHAKALAHAAELRAARAESKADIALQDSSYLTVEEFIGRNGLLQQFPHSHHAAISAWVKSFCQTYALPFHKDEVIGKSWETENHYPIQALLAYVRHAQQRSRQITLVRPSSEGAAHA